jgi:hypothetical protein
VSLSAILFGWPSVGLSLMAFAAGFLSRYSWLGLVGATLSLPFCFLTSLYPIPFGFVGGPVAAISNVAAGWFVLKGRREVAFACLLPFLLLASTMAVIVVGKSTVSP